LQCCGPGTICFGSGIPYNFGSGSDWYPFIYFVLSEISVNFEHGTVPVVNY
jgi:hypothetical protein